jgi:uncharacterized membrane protein YuzA (DUF378 family)
VFVPMSSYTTDANIAKVYNLHTDWKAVTYMIMGDAGCYACSEFLYKLSFESDT